MGRSEDLNAALEFVATRIEQESTSSGEPLNEDELWLLNNLSTHSVVLPQTVAYDPEFPPVLIPPRDANYERLIALAKSAYRKDSVLDPASRDWEFAITVLKLNRHPMNWLLQWAGVKQPRPWWDRWLLVIGFDAVRYNRLDSDVLRSLDKKRVTGNTFWRRLRSTHTHLLACLTEN
jgi:hypothetical protein